MTNTAFSQNDLISLSIDEAVEYGMKNNRNLINAEREILMAYNEKWKTIYKLISMTFYKKGSSPYFSYEFFVEISKKSPSTLLVITAEKNNNIIGASVFFVGTVGLYGRYWGTDEGYDSLHFETCYYQGIDYCIKNNLKYFEPGTGGEHKISRGFRPNKTFSAHYLSNSNFSIAIENYLQKESQYIDNYIENIESHSPYRLEI